MQSHGRHSAMPEFWVARGMARAIGANLTGAVQSHRLSREGLDRMVAVCASCPHKGDCLGWLGRNAAGAAHPPAYCINAGAFAALV